METKTNNATLHLKCLFLLLGSYCLSGCGDECSSYSKYSCEEIQSATYNTYFYYPNNKEVFLGVAQGLSECGSLAFGHADSKNMSRDSGWSYICCMKTDDSECKEKHR